MAPHTYEASVWVLGIPVLSLRLPFKCFPTESHSLPLKDPLSLDASEAHALVLASFLALPKKKKMPEIINFWPFWLTVWEISVALLGSRL